MVALLGIDTGGTFTDFVYYNKGELSVHKELSTPDAPEQAILQGINTLGLSLQGLLVIHGSTVATNAVLESKGAQTVYITHHGLKDVLTIGRQARAELYNLQPQPIPTPLAESACLETGGRISAKGELLDPLTDEHINIIINQLEAIQPQSVAINFLFSYIDDCQEVKLAEALKEQYFVSYSADILPQVREYERGMATWMNAYIGPVMQRYLSQLEHDLKPAQLAVMQSSAGTIDAQHAGKRAVNLLLSGPAAGLMAAQYVGRQLHNERLLTFDMGGTSTDVALIDGEINLTSAGKIGPYPVAVPMVDMHTIGAGGGSIAYLDEGQMLHVGPASAGANPGPACYGLGGEFATVTDANVVLGRLPADLRLGGHMPIDADASLAVVKKLAITMKCGVREAAEGIVRIANEHMVQALKAISVQKGCDPRDYTLVCFGGAGGLHVCELAETLQMTRIVIPQNGGVLSAFGMLVTPARRFMKRSVIMGIETVKQAELCTLFEQMAQEACAALSDEGVDRDEISISYYLDLRYVGQSNSLTVKYHLNNNDIMTSRQQFISRHRSIYGHDLSQPIEISDISVSATGPERFQAPSTGKIFEKHRRYNAESQSQADIDVIARHAIPLDKRLSGPLIITEALATTYVGRGWRCQQGRGGHLELLLN
jgi:N-methylhydantoinase A